MSRILELGRESGVVYINTPQMCHWSYGLSIYSEVYPEKVQRFEKFCKNFFWNEHQDLMPGAFYQGGHFSNTEKYFEMLSMPTSSRMERYPGHYLALQNLLLQAAMEIATELDLEIEIE